MTRVQLVSRTRSFLTRLPTTYVIRMAFLGTSSQAFQRTFTGTTMILIYQMKCDWRNFFCSQRNNCCPPTRLMLSLFLMLTLALGWIAHPMRQE